MSCFGFCGEAEAKEATATNAAINKDLKKYKKHFENELRLLLLGTGESGKSTIVKQMRIIHSTGFSDKEREQMCKPILGNIANSIKAIVEFCDLTNISLNDPESVKAANWVKENVNEDDYGNYNNTQFYAAVAQLWGDEGIQQAYNRSNEFQLNDSAKYFFDILERVSQPGYVPTDQDMLQARTVTTGIFETKFVVNAVVFHMFDVGGQRSERRKWIQCFADVTGIIFTVATSAYNQCLREDASQNRLVEALELFASIWKNRWLAKVSVVLFLNKCDLLKTKIHHSKMSLYFEDYK
eukprot:Ihof_evm1s126 gene=Ihof_evmTU1s126